MLYNFLELSGDVSVFLYLLAVAGLNLYLGYALALRLGYGPGAVGGGTGSLRTGETLS